MRVIERGGERRGVPLECVICSGARAEAVVVRRRIVSEATNREYLGRPAVREDQVVTEVHVGTGAVITDLADKSVLIEQHARRRVDELQVAAGRRAVNQVLVEVQRSAESGLRAERAAGGIETAIPEHPD